MAGTEREWRGCRGVLIVRAPQRQDDSHGIFDRSRRSLYFSATSLTSSINLSESVVGTRPRESKLSFLTSNSLKSASLRGLGAERQRTPVISEIRFARSITRCVSVIWLKMLTRRRLSRGLLTANSMQRTVSRMLIKARVCPPDPLTVSG